MLQTFLPLFFMTFGICLFIVLLQFIWRYIDDMVGKGLSIPVLGEMLFYAVLYMLPTALPLSILLASLMTFGNLGERFELLAMKSAGVSLIRIMRPLIILICFIAVGGFYFQNNITPVAQVKLYSLIYSIRQKSPELDIPEGAFYSDITGYNVYVKNKDSKTGLLKNVMIYDYSRGFDNATVILADSGRLKVSSNKLFLVLSLYNGESFENLQEQKNTGAQKKQSVPYRRETFSSKDILIEFDATFNRMDESLLQNNYMGQNLKELETSMDSLNVRLDSIRSVNARTVMNNSYRRTVELAPPPPPPAGTPAPETPPLPVIDFDSTYQAQAPATRSALLSKAISNIEVQKADYFFKAATLEDDAYRLRRHFIEWHKKFTLSFVCLVFFFIGAPLGAIIRKGGLGMPVVISVLFFIIYYIIDNIGFKMARDNVWEPWQGIWLSSAVLVPVGIFLTYKAVNDSVLLNADTYTNAIKNLLGKHAGRNIVRKEVIIYTPDYEKMVHQIDRLTVQANRFLEKSKRWVPYFTYWRQGNKDHTVKEIGREVENLVEEGSNSDQILILNKLMDYPILKGYRTNSPLSGVWSLLLGLFFPLGIPIYLISMYKRKLLLHDIRTIVRVNAELKQIIEDNLDTKII